MATIRYREGKPSPEQFFELFETTGWNALYRVSASDLQRALEGSWHVIAAYDGEQLVGLGRVVSDGVLYAMIYDMIVRPSHQGRGIGTAILHKLVEACKSAGLGDIQLFSAKGQADFYRKRGFLERPADAPGMRMRKD
jgi:GNAT superfamily N-acetyltransferase